MAKAYANCTCETCGAKFEKIMYGNNRHDADSKAEWAAGHFTECQECEEKRVRAEREAENAAAAIEAQESGLPALTGSEKQAAWATSIRQKIYDTFTAALDERERRVAENEAAGKKVSRAKESCRRVRLFLRWLISEHTAAHWWIDNRESLSAPITDILAHFQADFLKWHEANATVSAPAPETPDESELRKAAETEMIIAPETRKHPGAADIVVTDKEVTAIYEKDDDFIAIAKRLGYRWNAARRVWRKAIGERTGAAPERAAELGNNLLCAGFAVRIANPEIRKAAVAGDYAPEHMRWIWMAQGEAYRNKLLISWGREDDFYAKAKALRGARYDKPDVSVPLKNWEEVLDFAQAYDFRVTSAAQAAIDAQRAAVIIVSPAPVKAAAYQEHDPAEILKSGAGILEDLTDED